MTDCHSRDVGAVEGAEEIPPATLLAIVSTFHLELREKVLTSPAP